MNICGIRNMQLFLGMYRTGPLDNRIKNASLNISMQRMEDVILIRKQKENLPF